jgi:uncharacterized protein
VSASRPSPDSPCVSICALDLEDICTGCYRSAAEITDWFMASDAEKYDILRRARERRERCNPSRLG